MVLRFGNTLNQVCFCIFIPLQWKKGTFIPLYLYIFKGISKVFLNTYFFLIISIISLFIEYEVKNKWIWIPIYKIIFHFIIIRMDNRYFQFFGGWGLFKWYLKTILMTIIPKFMYLYVKIQLQKIQLIVFHRLYRYAWRLEKNIIIICIFWCDKL